MPAYLYVMRSACTGRHAIGATRDLDDTFAQALNTDRNLGAADAPWECVYIEICDGIEQAEGRVAEISKLEDPDQGVELLYTSRIRSQTGRGGRPG